MSKNNLQKTILTTVCALSAMLLTACGGGGGGGGGNDVIYYPFENVYGDICVGEFEPVPGCTFNRDDGSRVYVTQSSDYNIFGGGADDLILVEFAADGSTAFMYELIGGVKYAYIPPGEFDNIRDISEFAGFKGGSFIGVGTTGVFWEDVTLGDYLMDANNVLFDNNVFESDYHEAINNKVAGQAVDTDVIAANEAVNDKLVAAATNKLMVKYGFKASEAQVVASQLNRFAVNVSERGYSTPDDIKTTFSAVFGVEYNNAVAAVSELMKGNPELMNDAVNRSATKLKIKPRMAKQFYKDNAKKALSDFGYTQKVDW